MTKTYTIQKTAEEMSVSAHTLRYYEKIGLLHPIQRGANGHRRYTEEDMGWIYWLKLLRDSDMSIQAMQKYVALTREGEHTIPERCEILAEHRDSLRQHITELQEYLTRLENKVEYYRGFEWNVTEKRTTDN